MHVSLVKTPGRQDVFQKKKKYTKTNNERSLFYNHKQRVGDLSLFLLEDVCPSEIKQECMPQNTHTYISQPYGQVCIHTIQSQVRGTDRPQTLKLDGKMVNL